MICCSIASQPTGRSLAPAMNPLVWNNAATANVALERDGVAWSVTGEMAEAGEAGVGRMAGPGNHLCCRTLRARPRPLARSAVITAGPTMTDRCALHRQPLVRQTGCHCRGRTKRGADVT